MQKISDMDLVRACRTGDVEECRRLWTDICPIDRELSLIHWLLLGLNTSDEACLSILELFGNEYVNHLADNVALSGLSHIQKVSSVSPLHLGVLYKGPSVVSKLLEMSCNPDLCDSNGETSLMYACREGSLEKVSILLEANADVAHISQSGDFALRLGVSPEIKSLIQLRTDRLLLKSLQQRDSESVKSLLRVKANPNDRSIDGSSAMEYAVEHGDYDTILQILESGGETKADFLHRIIVSGNLSVDQKVGLLGELIYMGLDVNHRNEIGKTPIDLAKDRSPQSPELVHFLIENGARDTSPNRQSPVLEGSSTSITAAAIVADDSTEFESAAQIKFTQSQAARNFGVGVDLSDLAIRAGTLISELEMSNRFVGGIGRQKSVSMEELRIFRDETERKLEALETEFCALKTSNKGLADFRAIGHFMELQKGIADLRSELTGINQMMENAPSENTPSPEPEIASGWFRSPDSVEADLENCIASIRRGTGTVLNAESAIFDFLNNGGAVPHSQSVQILKLLRNRGADVNYTQSEDGVTSLMLVCDSAKDVVELVDFLLSNSANFEAKESERGWTCLHFAAARGNFAVCQKLLKRIKQQVADKTGKYPLDYCENYPRIRDLMAS